MKSIFTIFILSIIICSNSYAITMTCGQAFTSNDVYDEVNHQFGFNDEIGKSERRPDDTAVLLCETHGLFKWEKDYVKFYARGKGLGLKFTAYEGFMITCPLIFSAKKLVENNFYGIKASAGLGIGASVGVMMNERLGACILTGLSAGTAGVSISGDEFIFNW